MPSPDPRRPRVATKREVEVLLSDQPLLRADCAFAERRRINGRVPHRLSESPQGAEPPAQDHLRQFGRQHLRGSHLLKEVQRTRRAFRPVLDSVRVLRVQREEHHDENSQVPKGRHHHGHEAPPEVPQEVYW